MYALFMRPSEVGKPDKYSLQAVQGGKGAKMQVEKLFRLPEEALRTMFPRVFVRPLLRSAPEWHRGVAHDCHRHGCSVGDGQSSAIHPCKVCHLQRVQAACSPVARTHALNYCLASLTSSSGHCKFN